MSYDNVSELLREIRLNQEFDRSLLLGVLSSESEKADPDIEAAHAGGSLVEDNTFEESQDVHLKSHTNAEISDSAEATNFYPRQKE